MLSTISLLVISTLIDMNIAIKTKQLSKMKIFRLFSMVNIWRQFGTMKNGPELNALYVFRVAILIWIIIVHTFIIVDFQYFREYYFL